MAFKAYLSLLLESNKLNLLSITSLFILGMSTIASSTTISYKPTFDLLLGSGGITEDFEALNQSNGQYTITGHVLDSSTNGGGLVVDGVTFTNIDSKDLSNGIQWNAIDYFGQTSQNITAGGGTLRIDFHDAVTVFGFDLGIFSGYPDSPTIRVYGEDGITKITEVTISGSSSNNFIGFYDIGLISSVTISGNNDWSPLVDNVSFNTVATVPVPQSFWLLFSGLLYLTAAVKRKSCK